MAENERALAITNYDETSKVAAAMVRSGFFKDVKSADQAMIKIWAGRELGVSAVEAMRGIYIIEGNLTPSAGLTAALVKRSGKYNYRLKTSSDSECSIEFFEAGQSVGVSTYTIEEAKKAGLASKANWTKSPSDMLFARAMTRGARRFCADVFGGSIYDEGELIDAEAVPAPPAVRWVDQTTGEIKNDEPAAFEASGKPTDYQQQKKFWATIAERTGLKGDALKTWAYVRLHIESFNDDWLPSRTWDEALSVCLAWLDSEEESKADEQMEEALI